MVSGQSGSQRGLCSPQSDSSSSSTAPGMVWGSSTRQTQPCSPGRRTFAEKGLTRETGREHRAASEPAAGTPGLGLHPIPQPDQGAACSVLRLCPGGAATGPTSPGPAGSRVSFLPSTLGRRDPGPHGTGFTPALLSFQGGWQAAQRCGRGQGPSEQLRLRSQSLWWAAGSTRSRGLEEPSERAPRKGLRAAVRGEVGPCAWRAWGGAVRRPSSDC